MGKGKPKGSQGKPLVTVEYACAAPEQRAENRRAAERALEAAMERQNRFPVKAEINWRTVPKRNRRP